MLVDIGTVSVPQAADGIGHVAHVFDVRPQTVPGSSPRDHLRHTAICEDAVVVAAIGDWLSDRR